MSTYYNLPTKTIENKFVKLDYLAEAGPRLVRLSAAGSDANLFAEVPDSKTPTPWGEYRFLGGHRLWHSPEDLPRTYVPDNEGLVISEHAQGVTLGNTEGPTGIAKSIDIRLAPDQPKITLVHKLENTGLWPVELAPWALSQLALGGIAIFPLPVGSVDPAGLLPNRQVSLWPYTRLTDERLELHDDFMIFHARPQLPPFKVGYFSQHGWTGYYNKGVFLRKTQDLHPDMPYPDFNCTTETYCNDQFIELETLGPLRTLKPGESTTLTETWDLFTNLADAPDLTDEMRQAFAD
ncbi:MAG: hypothetical protein JXA13_02345 [Anaerolineales bacterium]|nr:hypothetical protein [Anaerolineales bacterium]